MGYFIWKVFSVPYHILIHDKTLLGAIDALSSHLYGAGGGPKYGYLGGKNRAAMAGLLWGEDPARKPFYAPYHISLHGPICIWAIFDLSMHIYGPGWVQYMAILGLETG